MLLCIVMLSAGATFAADNATLADASDEIAIEENVLTANDDFAAESGNAILAEGTDNNKVTNDTFFNFFGKDGILLDNVTSDELIFDGEFGDLDGVSYVTINKPISFTGNGGAVFNGIGFVVNSSDVNIDGFSVFQKNTPYGILIGGDNVVISNNYLEFTANAELDSYGIYAMAPNNLQIIDNTIVYEGNTNGTVVNNAVRIEGDDEEGTPASSIVVSGNDFELKLPSVDVGYDPVTWAATYMSEGIVFYYCEDLEFVDNRVNLKYGDVTTAYGYDSLYAVSVRSDAYSFGDVQSSDVLIANNTIDIEGYDCAYAVYVCADDFEVYGNNITSISENYLGHGVDIDGPSSSGSVSYNIIDVVAPDAYGIYSYQYMGAIEDIVYSNNLISVGGYLAGGMEIVECNPSIVSNTIYADGNYTYGIVTSIRDFGLITGNEIVATGSNTGDDPTGDGLMPKNSMAISVKGEAVISNNIIGSSNIGIKIVEKGGVVINNNTIGVETAGLLDSYGIYAKGVDNITIVNNDILFASDADGTVISNGVRIEGDDDEDEPSPATNIVVSGNTFDLYIPSVDVGYDPVTWAATTMSEGIVFYYCEDLEFVDNIIDLEYYTFTTAYGYDSVYAVSVKSDAYTFDFDDEDNIVYPIISKDVLIANNTIEVEGHAYAYGITVAAEDFEVSGNNVTVTSEINMGHGIDVAAPSFDGLVDDNWIYVEAPSAYGIYSDGSWLGPVDTVTYSNNKIEVDGYLAGAFELMEKSPSVIDNIVVANGNYTYGVVASIYDEGEISGNEIVLLGSDEGTMPTGDSLMPRNSMGVSVKGNCLIDDNIIVSPNIGINLVEGGNVTVTNNIIDVEANAPTASYGIHAKYLSNLTIAGNDIKFVGNTDGAFVNNAILVEGDDDEDNPAPATNIVVTGNTFDLQLPSVDVAYDPVTWAATYMSEGIVFYYCEDLEFVDNRVDLVYNNVTTAYGYDSLYAVSVRSDAYTFGEVQSKYVIIADNEINIDGHSAAYAVYVCADDFSVYGNNITSTSETYLAHGIDVDGPSAVGAVIRNNIVAEAPVAAYGIYSYQYMGAIEDISYSINTIDVAGYASAGMEIVECNPEIMGNVITAEGNYTYGIIASIRDEGVISKNNISVLGSNIGDDATGDGLMPKNSMAISVKGSSTIAENNLESTDIGINLVEDGQITVDDNTINVKSNTEDIDNHAVVANAVDYLVFTNNEVNYVGATTPKGEYKTAKAYAMYVIDSEVNVENNTFFIVVPSLPSDWEQVGDDWVRHSYTEGLVFDTCDFSKVVNNEITLEYDGGDFGSIYAIDVLNSDNFVIEYNEIEASGEDYMYGIIVEGDDFEISQNLISVESEYYTNGIDIEESAGGIIDKNVIDIISPGTAYPIYGGMVGEPSVEITNNTIIADSYFIVGVELSGKEAAINDNIIDIKGNYTIGIGVYVDELIANNNTIRSKASNVGNVSIWDSVGTDTTGIKSKKGTVTIIDNFIETTGNYTVDIADDEGTVHDNYLTAKKRIGDNSVYSTGAATVYDNRPNIKVVLFASDLDKVYDDGQLFTVVALDEDGEPVINVTLRASIEDLIFLTVTDEKGVAEFDIELPEGIYDVTTDFLGNEVYGPKQINNTITVTTKDTVIVAPESVEVTAIEVKEHDAVVDVWLTDVDGKPLANKPVIIEFNGVGGDFITDENGTVKYSLWGDAGEYALIVKFDGDENYSSSEFTTDVSIVLVESEITAPAFVEFTAVEVKDHSAIVDLTLADIDGNPLANKTVIIELNGVGGEFTTDENGSVQYALWGDAGDYELIVKFDGDDCYAASNATTDVSIVLVESEILAPVFAQFTTVDVAEGNAIINITLTDINENPLANKPVFIGIDGGEGKYTTDENGAIQLRVLANAGEHTIAIEFAGDGCYGPSNATTEISIVPVESQIIAPEYAEYTSVEVKEHNATFDLTLVDADGNPLANMDVVIELNGVGDHFITDENGTVKYSIWGDAGNYTLIAKFEGDERYTKSNATADIVITPVKTEIVAPESAEYSIADVISGNATFDLTLVDADGNLLANKTILITFNGVTEDFTTDENGTIEYVIKADAGNYTVDMAFESDGCYDASNASATVSIVKEQQPTKIFLRNALYFVLENKIVNVTLWDANNNPIAGKTVHITIGNSTWSGVTDENGTAHIRVGIGFGVHDAVVHFDGDDDYSASNRSGYVRVIKETPSLMVRNVDTKFKADDPIKIVKVYLWDRTSKPLPAGSKIVLKINGQTYVGYTDSEGIARMIININKAGTFNAEVKYAGNSAYNAVTRNVKFVIS